jgi:hypothetical protein
LWQKRNFSNYAQERKTAQHPVLGLLALDWAILNTKITDLRVVS